MVDVCHSLAELQSLAPLFSNAAVAVGNFDGVHKGHAHILEIAVERARAGKGVAVALTFDPHPRAVVGNGAPPALATLSQRRALIRALGIDAIVALRFDENVAGLAPERFVEDVLVRGLGAVHVVVGDNFRFGRRALGTTQLLTDLGRRFGYTVHTAPAVRLDDDVISSSLVRSTLVAGDVAAAARLLGRNYAVKGAVVSGEGRGATLGFPTANIAPEAGLLLPGPGVYLARVFCEPAGAPGATAETPSEAPDGLDAVAVVSDKPTFGHREYVLEVHLLGYDGQLRDQKLSVEFLERLRDVVRFDSVAELQTQMHADVETARQRFRTGAVL